MTVSRETDWLHCLSSVVAVSRETADRLALYDTLLVKWQTTINLVGPATMAERLHRHFLDSAQLLPHLPAGPILDMGSGAGFPGLVLAILRNSDAPYHLVESDVRKCAFLREVARQTAPSVIIHNRRLETVPPFPVAGLTARALAPLGQLLDWAEPFLTSSTECLFLKGRTAEEELTETRKNWKMTADRIPSVTDPTAVIFHLREVHRGRDGLQTQSR